MAALRMVWRSGNGIGYITKLSLIEPGQY